MADDDLFRSIRSSAARADVPAAEDVRRRGEQRTRSQRLLVGSAALLVVAGTGAVLLTGGGGSESLRPAPVAVTPTPSAGPTSAEPTVLVTPDPSVPVVPTAPVATTLPLPPSSTRATAAATRTPSAAAPPRASSSRPGAASTRPATPTAPASATTPAPPAATPRLTVDLRITSADGAAAVTYVARVRGTVPQLQSAEEGGGVVRGDDQLLGTDVAFSNGATDGSDGGNVRCVTGAPLVPTSLDFQQGTDSSGAVATFAPGTYTVTFTARACGTEASDTATFTVR